MILVVHPTGNTFVRALLRGLEQDGRPYAFLTSLDHRETSWLPGGLRRQLARRSYGIPSDRVLTRPWREWGRLISQRLGWSALHSREASLFSVDSVYRDLSRHAVRLLDAGKGFLQGRKVETVYAYEDGAAEIFECARRLGIRRVYDLPIAYWETGHRLLAEEAVRYPEWEPTLQSTRDSIGKLQRKTRELADAQLVLCPSRMVQDSIPDGLKKDRRLEVVEFGTPDASIVPSSGQASAGKVRFLFAGTLTQRKGLADLFSAWKRLGASPEAELLVLGTPVMPLEFYQMQCAGWDFLPSRPHNEVLQLMDTCDVLVLPSIVEGRALVQQEAMSRGLPLIVTRNAGGEDLVEEGRTGHLIPIRDPETLADRLRSCIGQREHLRKMGEHARVRAAHYTWDRYAKRILELL